MMIKGVSNRVVGCLLLRIGSIRCILGEAIMSFFSWIKSPSRVVLGRWAPGDHRTPTWTFEWSPNIPLAPTLLPNNGFKFDFPGIVYPNGEVHYVTQKPLAKLTNKVVVKGWITIAPGTVFSSITKTNMTPGSGKARVYFQRKGDDWGGLGNYQYYRWWYTGYIDVEANGAFTFTAPLSDAANWISVYGNNAAEYPAQRQAAIDNMDRIGLTFGGGGGYGHGLYITYGAAKFEVTSFEVS